MYVAVRVDVCKSWSYDVMTQYVNIRRVYRVSTELRRLRESGHDNAMLSMRTGATSSQLLEVEKGLLVHLRDKQSGYRVLC